MKKFILVFLIGVLMVSAHAQVSNFIGNWQGQLEVANNSTLLVFRISETSGDYKATIDIPEQMIMENKVQRLEVEGDSIFIEVFTAKYNAVLVENNMKLTGVWKQNGVNIPLILEKKTDEEVFTLKRPQTPQPPYPYISEDVKFENKKAGITMSGTFTKPKGEGVFPVVILISGSGPQDRNEELLKHKPFLVIADYLSRNGYAVLRYDDRGVGESEGNFQLATTEDFYTDGLSAYTYLKSREDVDSKAIGVCGHSEGGMIAQMMASKLKKKLAFAIFLAAPGVNIDRLMILQNEAIFSQTEIEEDILEVMLNIYTKVFTILQAVEDPTERAKQIREVYADMTIDLDDKVKSKYGLNANGVNAALMQYGTPWFMYFISYKPEAYIKKIKCPLLILNGENDVQVVPDENTDNLDRMLRKYKHKDYTINKYPELNHLFQSSITGMPAEYAMIEETISPLVLSDMLNWLNARFQ